MAKIIPGRSTNTIRFNEKQIKLARDALTSGIELRNMIFVWTLQFFSLAFVIYEQYTDELGDEKVTTEIDPILNATRLISAIVLHLNVEPEVQQGYKMMKYVLNHQWKFQYYKSAFMIGYLQMQICTLVELSNLFTIFVSSTTVSDVIANFLVILVISEFDDYFYAVSGQKKLKEYVTEDKYENLLTFETTSSAAAKAEIDAHKLEETRFKNDE